MSGRSGHLRTVLVSGAAAALVAGGGVYAANTVGTNDIRDGAVRSRDVRDNNLKSRDVRDNNLKSRDVRDNSLTLKDLRDSSERALTRAAQRAGFKNPQWGIITRNHIGSAVADLRGGPFGTFGVEGEQASPPYGEGSLGIAVSDNAMSGTHEEKAAFGNEIDFYGDPVSGVQEVGFHVFQTNENHTRAPENLPSIQFEIDPNLETSTSNYSTLVYNPEPVADENRNRWSPYIDGTESGDWGLTGGAGTATGCDQNANRCSWSELQDALDDGGDEATIYTLAITKGRDHAWVGAVDGLRINDTIYDFEPLGVFERRAI
jgi:hypothetical protein